MSRGPSRKLRSPATRFAEHKHMRKDRLSSSFVTLSLVRTQKELHRLEAHGVAIVMAPREDLVNSAVSFLQDPSVASAPLDKRRAFLSSKNLTEEEIQLALARAGDDLTSASSTPSQATQNYPYSTQQRPPPPGYASYNAYNSYGPYPPWPPQQTPEPPRRDWRDWFIMATVTAGVGYGVYTAAKRYILPLISPPTPPQLETDKAAIDASFARAFSLLDQLQTDTQTLKDSEAQRSEKLDSSLSELDATITELKENNKRREEEARRINDDIRGLREIIPKALEGWKGEGDNRLKELSGELRSLKMLVGHRVGGGGSGSGGAQAQGQGQGQQNGVPATGQKASGARSGTQTPTITTNGSSASPAFPSDGANDQGAGTNANSSKDSTSGTAAPAPGVTAPKREASSSPSPFAAFGGADRPAQRAIPAWQLAASRNSHKSNSSSTSASGTAAGEEDGVGASGS